MIDVSVVIPTFRRPALLAEAIESALAQTGISVEIIVVDDSPEGSAREVVDRFAGAPVSYLKNEPPSGGSPARVRNAGWPRAAGRFVHFLDDDDRVASGFYRAALDAFAKHPTRGVVFGGVEPFAADTQALSEERAFFERAQRRARIAWGSRSRHWMVATLLFQDTLLVNSACLIRRECIGPLQGYDPEIPMNEDVEFYMRAIRRFGCVFLDRTVLHYRILSDSLMHGRKDNSRISEAYRRMHGNYRRTNGSAELFLLKIFSRTVLRFL